MKTYMSKASVCGALMGMMLMVGSLPAMSSPAEPTDPSLINLNATEVIRGTFQGFHMGQILMKTDGGENVELPSMALFFSDPQISQGQLQVGQALAVTIPKRSVLRVIDATGPVVTLGSYSGVSKIPQVILTGWNTDNSIWSAQR